MGLMQIVVTKGKGTVDIDTDKLPDEVYQAALAEGLKAFVNKGMSKIMTKGLEGTELESAQQAAMTKAQENASACLDGTIKLPGRKAKAKGASGAVMTEARRLARNLIKDEMKRAGIKISHVEASEITKAANALLDQDPSIVETAKANIAERDKVDVGAKINIKALIKESPKLIKAAEERKAKSKNTLSAKQAGMTKKSKPKDQPQA